MKTVRRMFVANLGLALAMSLAFGLGDGSQAAWLAGATSLGSGSIALRVYYYWQVALGVLLSGTN